ncbi:CGNR zinc finger domain-containing protein [Paucibacter sp. R3-3]|uniref:CGNR zinc finger domain-containing protein n=1 Tax=Roseateles agri TaxID=3098619 RepID=A0ABU5DCN0_9BURK|nr:ABATE domain-containing protein [Paucibacter sp. R3-3]MDY0744025.1 CGNR zinc finger domain-containing protein [Paucibacter sp. R3-3]
MPDTLPPPMFLADSRGLDFLNTLAVPVDTEVEWLASGEDLLAWLQSAGLLSAEAADEVRSVAKPGELDDAAAKARGLREWFRGFVRQYRGEPLTRKAIAELEPLNELLARDEEFSQIVPSSDEASLLAFVPRRRWRSADSLLFPIAKTLAELLTTADFSNVKQCEGPGCVLHFLDTTRDRRRRWCSMAVCGNRAKQAALRLRRAANAGS